MTESMRKCLELAAKAAGYTVRGPAWEFIGKYDRKDPHLVIVNENGGDSVWNPYVDDGDAFKLAIRLKLTIYHEDVGRHFVEFEDEKNDMLVTMVEENEEDPIVATRLLIVAAAADMGQ